MPKFFDQFINHKPGDEDMTESEAAAELGVDRATLTQMRKGMGRHVPRIGQQYFYPKKTVTRWKAMLEKNARSRYADERKAGGS